MKAVFREVRKVVDLLIQGEEEVSKWVKQSRVIKDIARIPGDASTRRYYRVWTQEETYIAMKMEPFADVGKELNFLVVQEHLSQMGVDVPQVMDVDPARGFILLEDLGDQTLLHRLKSVADMDVERELYEQVLDSLVHLQVKAGPQKGSKKSIEAFKLHFDFEKLIWEMDNTVRHFYELHLERTITKRAQKILTDGFTSICKELAEQPTVFTHRDFHSRNIMVVPKEEGGDRLVMIDFQDARMGPQQYDLVSLLRDSYYQLEQQQVERLIDYYMARWKAISGGELDRDEFLRVFDLMTIQRNFKAIGSFASFMNRRGNAKYLKYIGNTFENIRRVLLKYPEYSALREVLFHYYYF